MRIGAGFLVAFLGSVPALSSAADAPTGFRDLPWGTLSAETRNHPDGCDKDALMGAVRPYGASVPGSFCHARRLNLGSAWADVTLQFIDDRLAGYLLQAKGSDYRDLRESALAKFGPPTRSEAKTYQNAFGAKFTGEVLTWLFASGGTAQLTERCTKITHACLMVTTPAFLEAQKRHAEERKARKPAF